MPKRGYIVKYKKKHRMRRHVSTSNYQAHVNMKVIGTVQCSNAGGAPAVIANAFALNFPTYFRNSAATYGQLGVIPTAFTRALAMFDAYRVKGMRVKYIPNFVDTVESSTVNEIPNVIYMARDRDDVALPTEVQILNDGIMPIQVNQGVAKMSLYFPQLKANKNTWINTANVSVLPTAATTGNTILPVNAYASIKTLQLNIPATTVAGRYYIEWYVQFRGISNS